MVRREVCHHYEGKYSNVLLAFSDDSRILSPYAGLRCLPSVKVVRRRDAVRASTRGRTGRRGRAHRGQEEGAAVEGSVTLRLR